MIASSSRLFVGRFLLLLWHLVRALTRFLAPVEENVKFKSESTTQYESLAGIQQTGVLPVFVPSWGFMSFAALTIKRRNNNLHDTTPELLTLMDVGFTDLWLFCCMSPAFTHLCDVKRIHISVSCLQNFRQS